MPELTDFEGRWRLTRHIADALGPDATFQGFSTFTKDAQGLSVHEEGRLDLEGQGGFQAERRYLWRQVGGQIAVFFHDGRDFHRFDPAQTAAQATHWCDPDTYQVRYAFDAWPEWSAQWRVKGPRKDYVMRSLYTRDDAISPTE